MLDQFGLFQKKEAAALALAQLCLLFLLRVPKVALLLRMLVTRIQSLVVLPMSFASFLKGFLFFVAIF